MKFEFRESDKMRVLRLVSSPKTHGKKSANTFKSLEEN